MILVMNSNGFSILLRSTSSSTLSVSASWHTWESSCAAAVWRVATGRRVLSEELSPSLKELTLISWGRDVFLPSYISSGRPDLSRIGFGVGWVGWKNFACRATSPSGCRATFETNSLVHSCFNEIFGGGRSDMLTFSYKTSPVFNLTTFGTQ